jgi:hypothetical protein
MYDCRFTAFAVTTENDSNRICDIFAALKQLILLSISVAALVLLICYGRSPASGVVRAVSFYFDIATKCKQKQGSEKPSLLLVRCPSVSSGFRVWGSSDLLTPGGELSVDVYKAGGIATLFPRRHQKRTFRVHRYQSHHFW